jgi:5'-methylthioadenosine nucleosidase
MSKKRLFLQFAMKLEAKPILDILEATRIFPEWVGKLPFEIYQTSLGELDLLIGLAGADPRHECDSIGSVPAAVLAQLAITNFHPQLVINAGTCGGFQSKGHQIADVLVGTRYVAFHHRRSSIASMRDYGIGKYKLSDSSDLRQELGLREGIVTSGDALDYSKEDQEYIAANGGTLKEMEAAAIGWVCSFTKTPLLPIKSVTDWVDHPADTGKQFLANYDIAVEKLTHELSRVLKYLENHLLDDKVWNYLH